MVEDTCVGDKCPVYNRCRLKRADQCPNFIETVWVSDSGEKKITKDCAPKRLLLNQQSQVSQTVEMRRELHLLQNSVAQLAQAVVQLIKLKETNNDASLNDPIRPTELLQ